jgi:hypothetical protein
VLLYLVRRLSPEHRGIEKGGRARPVELRGPSPFACGRLPRGLEKAAAGGRLALTVESDRLVAFGDGIEGDCLSLTWGQTITLGAAARRLRLLH